MSGKGEGESSQSFADKPERKSASGRKVTLTVPDIKALARDEIAARYTEIEKYIATLEEKSEGLSTSDIDEKLKLQQQESTRRENVLVMRLATKEQEMQELLAQIQELKQSQTPATSQLKSTLLDPSVNLLFEKMKTELGDTKEKLEQAQNDLNAWKFTPDSVTGKKLMAKCRMLIAENQDLGKQLSQGRIAQLEAELALQKKYNEELTSSQDELNDFVLQLDEEVEGMESTICALQQQLKETKQKYKNSIEEMEKLKNISDHVKTKQKRTHDVGGSESSESEKKRAKSVESIETFGDDTTEGLGTAINTGKDLRLFERKTTMFNSRNPSSEHKLSSPDRHMMRDDEGQIADGTFDVGRTSKPNMKEGTNGEVYS